VQLLNFSKTCLRLLTDHKANQPRWNLCWSARWTERTHNKLFSLHLPLHKATEAGGADLMLTLHVTRCAADACVCFDVIHAASAFKGFCNKAPMCLLFFKMSSDLCVDLRLIGKLGLYDFAPLHFDNIHSSVGRTTRVPNKRRKSLQTHLPAHFASCNACKIFESATHT
jgi:hypothetical protein